MLEKILVLMVIGVIALLFFGNRLPQVMGDLGKGVRAFKDGMNEGSEGEPKPKRAGKSSARKAAKKTVAKKAK